jgi:hypothetical protein
MFLRKWKLVVVVVLVVMVVVMVVMVAVVDCTSILVLADGRCSAVRDYDAPRSSSSTVSASAQYSEYSTSTVSARATSHQHRRESKTASQVEDRRCDWLPSSASPNPDA